MKSISKLSEASEQRISSALSKVAELLDNGADPNDAIVKIASQERLPAGQVRLMVRAFNTGRSLEHLRSHDTLEEKAASFKLADASEVLERMFPSKVKTAAQRYTETVISDDYAMSPEHWLKRRKQAETAPMTKAASVESKVTPYPTYERREAKAIAASVQALGRTAESARTAAIKSAYAVVNTMDKVAEYFRGNDAIDFVTAAYNAHVVLGKRVEKLMQKVATDKTVAHRYRNDIKYLGNNWELGHLKMAATRVDWNEAPYSLIKAALDAVDTFASVRENLDAVKEGVAKERAELLRPFTGTPVARPYTGSVWSDKTAGIGSFARDTGAMTLANTVAEFAREHAMARPDKEQMVQKSLDSLGEPKHEDKLRAIRSQAMIHELMAGDPIISGYGYNDVINAHNNLSEIAPKAMQQREMAKAMIRQYLEQSATMSPFDLKQMLDVNESLDKRDMPDVIAKGGYRVGAMRGLGDPYPSQSQALPPPKPAKSITQTVLANTPLAGDYKPTSAESTPKPPKGPVPPQGNA